MISSARLRRLAEDQNFNGTVTRRAGDAVWQPTSRASTSRARTALPDDLKPADYQGIRR